MVEMSLNFFSKNLNWNPTTYLEENLSATTFIYKMKDPITTLPIYLIV